MKKIFITSVISLFFINEFALAKSDAQYPNTSGQVLFEFKPDHILKATKEGASSSNAYVNIEPDLALNFNKNWSIKTGWRIFPTMQQRNSANPERSRTILSEDRGINQDDTTLIVEELKAFFQNDDMKFFAGKYDATFATLYRKTKRIGVFTTDFTEDYELREKIGFGGAALLEDSEITFNTFFNDTSALSSSGFGKTRPRDSSRSGLAGNTQTLSSYSITIEGEKLFGIEKLFYNFGYRSLGVNSDANNARETGYTANFEYLHKLSEYSSIMPVIEIVKINNFTGKANRDARYVTVAAIGKYSNWTASATEVYRDIDGNYYNNAKNHDRQFQLTAGYKFANNISVDVSRLRLREDGYSSSMIGIMASYLYKF